MTAKDRTWFVSSLVAGLGLCVAIAAPTQATLGPNNYVWFGWLLLMFAVSVAVNRVQSWMSRPPAKPKFGAFVGAIAFVPFFLVFFPAMQWVQSLGPQMEYKNLPNLNWMTLLMIFGLFAPGGLLVNRVRAKRQPR